MPSLVPKPDHALRIFRERFLNREDVVAVMAPWGKPCPVEGNGTLEMLLRGHVLGEDGPEARVRYVHKRGTGAMKGRFRVGSYCPAPDASTRWLCLDFDGAGHAEALADAEGAAKAAWCEFQRLELPAYLERSGGGHGWHVWCFFDPPIEAKKAQAIGRGLAPTDALLASGGVANPHAGHGIEVFPKQPKIRRRGYGNLVWLPWWSGAANGGCRLFRPVADGSLEEFMPDDFDTVDPESADRVVVALGQAEQPHDDEPRETDRTWTQWRVRALEALPLEAVYGAWLTGNSAGAGWLECRDPSSATGDEHPSASVADGTGDAERAAFHSFISGDTISVFDFLIKQGRANDFREARARVAELSKVALPAGSSGSRSRKRRPGFEYRPSEAHLAVLAGVKALARDSDVYQRAQRLVRVIPDVTRIDPDISNTPPRLVTTLSAPTVWEILSAQTAWAKYDGRAQSFVPCEPPERVVSAVHRRGSWPGVRVLNGLTTAPILRIDGSVHSTPGYDDKTGLVYTPTGPNAKLKETPSQQDAHEAGEELLEAVCDFPFAGEVHRSAWLAALLSPLGWPAYQSGCPLFIFDAHTPGTGKTLLCDAIGMVVAGSGMVRTPYVSEDEEMRKRITSHALAGDPLVLIDNVPSGASVGWPSLDSALTAERWKDRVLSKSENAEIRLNIIWYATGNNLGIRSDMARRSLLVRLAAQHERPEERAGFRHHPLLPWIKNERPRLLAAGLTLLRAYLLAGQPSQKLSTLGSFEAWSDVVRQSIVWAGFPDPVETCLSRDPDADPERPAHTQALVGWRDLERVLNRPGGVTATEALRALDKEESTHQALRSALMELCPGKMGGLPSARSLGRRLRVLKGRWRSVEVDGAIKNFAFSQGPTRARGGVMRWTVQEQN